MIISTLAILGVLIWICALALLARGTSKAYRHFGPERVRRGSVEYKPVSILKPIKGLEPGLLTNLETLFNLTYSESFELLFSIAAESDPARPVIEELIAKYRRVDARLIVGDRDVGTNPKVNNLVRSYAEAKYDWIVISDSNVRVPADYLTVKASEFSADVGIVTGIVCGVGAETWGGHLEAAILNGFYARWMFIAQDFRQDCVVGKSMLFRRSQAERFGGLKQLGPFLAEDYMAGRAMRFLGLKVVMMRRPIEQPLARYTLADFWQRHLRWGRIRKSQAPLPVFFEPWSNLIPSGSLAAWSFSHLFGWSPYLTLPVHASLWLGSDLIFYRKMGGRRLRPSFFAAWLARELLSVPLWIHFCSGNKVNWRGRQLKVKSGGLLDSEA